MQVSALSPPVHLSTFSSIPFLHARSARIAALPTATLPNGLKAAYISRNDLFFLYHEIYEQQSYLQHGIHLQPGDTVLDVGANVGLFSLFASAAVGTKVTIFPCYGCGASQVHANPSNVSRRAELWLQNQFRPFLQCWNRTLSPTAETGLR